MQRYALALILLAGCTTPQPEPVDFVPAISVAVGVAETQGGGAVPAPAPAPGVCDNCNGTGKVGDGTVFVPCAACGGDGKIESLVATLLPGGGESESPSKAAPPVEWPAGFQPLRWDAERKVHVSADGKWMAAPGSSDWQSAGHFEDQIVCRGRLGCDTVRVWIKHSFNATPKD